ncbi:MAG: nucleotidyltransferase family protein [Candidatus Vogelbacteria bacterium]|nr:nucleotidyltransferase family protein [Candidatus Vogelbacteria bacterium]
MKAVILCAGLGTRLRPITDSIPKVMIDIGGKPLLQYHIEWLVGQGIRDVGINLFYLPNAITDYFGNGDQFGAKIVYSHQDKLAGTAADFKQFENFVGNDQCLIIYGDNLFILDLNKFKKFHNDKQGIASIAVKEWEDPTSKGIVGLDSSSRILWFKEKPKKEEVTTNIGNAGIYMVEPKIFSYIEKGTDQDFGKDIFPLILQSNGKIYGYKLTDYHIDIGTPETLEKGRRDIKTLYRNKP